MTIKHKCSSCGYELTPHGFNKLINDQDDGFETESFCFNSGIGPNCPICGKTDWQKVTYQ